MRSNHCQSGGNNTNYRTTEHIQPERQDAAGSGRIMIVLLAANLKFVSFDSGVYHRSSLGYLTWRLRRIRAIG